MSHSGPPPSLPPSRSQSANAVPSEASMRVAAASTTTTTPPPDLAASSNRNIANRNRNCHPSRPPRSCNSSKNRTISGNASHRNARESGGNHHPALDAFRRHSSLHYQTFPFIRPPTTSGKPLKRQSQSSENYRAILKRHNDTPDAGSASDSSSGTGNRTNFHKSLARNMSPPSPIPTRQLLVLALIALCEQTAFNSISPYLPEMVGLFPGVEQENVGVSVGMIASAFALAQFVTNFFWGHLSDRIGRKPVILCGTILTAVAFALFAFTRTLEEAIIVQAMMGMVNGNQGVVSTVLGEITDRSNQSAAFAYLPVVYGVGAILGPIMGGLLSSSRNSKYDIVRRFPYCLPNLASAALLVVDFVLCYILLDESLAEARDLPPLGKRIKNLFSWLWQFTSSTNPSYLRRHKRRQEPADIAEDSQIEPLLGRNDGLADDSGGESDDSDIHSFLTSSKPVPWREILTPSTIMLLVTYFIFNLAMIGYNALYPIFVSSPPPTGRGTAVRDIGLSLAFAGAVTIVFQVLAFARLQDRVGVNRSFKGALGLFALTFFAMPFVGYSERIGSGWLWTELAVVLAMKVVSSIAALTCAMILITNCAPNPSTLGSINGLAQTLSAAGRSFGPFAAGGLFTLGTRYKHGEWLPWGIFGAIAVLGCLASFGITRQSEKDDTDAEGIVPA